jgi:hypothetical protein
MPSVAEGLRPWRGWWIGIEGKRLWLLCHCYWAGKSTETALHRLVVWGEKALGQQETAPGVFLGIEGAFNYTSFDTIYAALVRHGVSTQFSGGLELSGGP